MKTLLHILALITITTGAALADTKVEAGPRKGRLLKLDTMNAEFFVENDHTISFAFYDAAKKQQPPAGQVIVATAEAPDGKKKLEFERKGNLLVSKAPLPDGEHYMVVVQAKESADAKAKNFRIKLELGECATCKNPEYACICDE